MLEGLIITVIGGLLLSLLQSPLRKGLKKFHDFIHVKKQHKRSNRKHVDNKIKTSNESSISLYNVDDIKIQKRYKHFLDSLYLILRLDQISSTGGWARSDAFLISKTMQNPPIPLLRSGNISPTYFALWGLLSYSSHLVKHNDDFEWVKKCYHFLDQRNDPVSGGFGSIVSTREGNKVDPTIRHTAAALLSMIKIGCSYRKLIDGLDYIIKSNPLDTFESLKSPVLDISYVFKLVELCAGDQNFINTLNLQNRDEIYIFEFLKDWPSTKLLWLSKINDVRDNYFPFWPPYGGLDKLTESSTLLALINLPELITAKIGEDRVLRIIDAMIEMEIDGGIPFWQKSKTPDIGMTSSFIFFLSNNEIQNIIKTSKHYSFYSKKIKQYFNYIITAFDRPELGGYDYLNGMILFSGLLMPKIRIKNISKVEHLELDKLIDEVLHRFNKTGKFSISENYQKFQFINNVLEQQYHFFKDTE